MSPQDSATTLIYEQTANERLRMFLRIEFLTQQFEHHCKASDTSYWDARAAVRTLLEFFDLIRQRNIKMDLISELDQRLTWLQMLRNAKDVDPGRLDETLQLHQDLRARAHGLHYPLHQHLSDYEVLNGLSQRIPLPGCTSEADQPLYANWLRRNPISHHAMLQEWYEPARAVTEIACTILDLMRRSSDFAPVTAQRGWYEQQLDPTRPHQMIRIRLLASSSFYPEISVTSKSFSIVFRDGGNLATLRPRQTVMNVDFDLACCLF